MYLDKPYFLLIALFIGILIGVIASLLFCYKYLVKQDIYKIKKIGNRLPIVAGFVIILPICRDFISLLPYYIKHPLILFVFAVLAFSVLSFWIIKNKIVKVDWMGDSLKN
jgi:ABC-type proline/glycine betaine transport system permease subunit